MVQFDQMPCYGQSLYVLIAVIWWKILWTFNTLGINTTNDKCLLLFVPKVHLGNGKSNQIMQMTISQVIQYHTLVFVILPENFISKILPSYCLIQTSFMFNDLVHFPGSEAVWPQWSKSNDVLFVEYYFVWGIVANLLVLALCCSYAIW